MASYDHFIDMSLGVFVFAALIGSIASALVVAAANVSGVGGTLLGIAIIFIVIAFIKGLTGKSK